MTITASLVKDLRARTGAGMMDCKKALVETDGDADAAAELLRTLGQAKADKKSDRIAAEGCVQFEQSADGKTAVLMEVNCETDFVARDKSFVKFAAEAATLAVATDANDVEALGACSLVSGQSLDEAKTELVATLGENIGIRRFERVQAQGLVGSYLHGARIGVAVDVIGGDAELARDIAMHIAASSPVCISEADVPQDELDKERRILTEQAEQEGKPAEIVAKMVDGRLRKHLAEITLIGQAFVKDPDTSVGKLLKAKGAEISSFIRYEVGEGIEKKVEDFAAEVQAQVDAAS
ncbi:MAG: translation elongation factor Ts [Gammaproteobacteria bacterium]